ncbi:MAG: radical SAM protein [Deltaproteobacteria bacterium]|nr:radical SAM protein [Deltaproteobacteria bacterium]
MAQTERPKMLFADDQGRIYDHPYMEMAGFDGRGNVLPRREDLTDLPEFSKLFFLPGRPPVGYDPRSGKMRVVEEVKLGKRRIRCHAVAAFPEPGYARTLLPAARYTSKGPMLPLWAYTAVGMDESGFCASAFLVEHNPAWDPRNYDDRDLMSALERMEAREGTNPLLDHVRNCAVNNHCFAAKNLFLKRWEAPLPVSRTCNARCLGCLSRQEEGSSCVASHDRISFRPTVGNVLDLAVPHLEGAENAIVSFGQGCEGEPLTESKLIAESVSAMRRQTSKGTINLNTNGSWPDRVAGIMDAGLDSIRISLNSARSDLYHAYYRPKGYSFQDVVSSLKLSVERQRFTMINYLIFPGITDDEAEIQALEQLLRDTGGHFVHFKNLCIDPGLYLNHMPRSNQKAVGIRTAYERIRDAFPGLTIGYFNKTVTDAGEPVEGRGRLALS